MVAADIRQGNDVYFNCDIRANPAPKTKIVTWLHNVSELIVPPSSRDEAVDQCTARVNWIILDRLR